MCNFRILIITGHELDHEEDNSRQEKRDTVEFNNSGLRILILQTTSHYFHLSSTTCVRLRD